MYGYRESLFPGTLRGYRTWFIEPYGTGLTTLRAMGSSGYLWLNGENKAECTSLSKLLIEEETHKAPLLGCTCGFYATHTPKLVLEEPICWHPNTVFGVVEATGQILVGKNGFRAEKARVVALSKWLTRPRLNRSYYSLRTLIFRGLESSYEESLESRNLSYVNSYDTISISEDPKAHPFGAIFTAERYIRRFEYDQAVANFVPGFHISLFHSALDRINDMESTNEERAQKMGRYWAGPDSDLYEHYLRKLEESYEVPVFTSLKQMVDAFPPIPLGDTLTTALNGQSS